MKHLILLFAIVFVFSCKESKQFIPIPTDGETIVKEDMESPVFSATKKAWKEKLFRTVDGRSFEDIQSKNAFNRFVQRNNKIVNRTPLETIADGLIEGEWQEKGSNNQAGSVFKTAYDDTTDELFLVSAGGQIWKGGLDGLSWEVVNQKARFNVRFLEVGYVEGNRRIVSMINRIPHYSDDDGLTWLASDANFVNVKDEYKVLDGTQKIFLLGRSTNDNQVNLYVSEDFGETYFKMYTFITNNINMISMAHFRKSDELYILESISTSATRVYKLNEDKSAVNLLENSSPVDLDGRTAKLVGAIDDNGTPYLYTISNLGGTRVYRSTDEGKTWTDQGELPSNPWNVGIFVSSENPEYLMYGDIECYRTYDGGQNWEMINGWAEYYGDVVHKLHADMMWFSDYIDEDTGEYFMLISNHGGISKMYDYDDTPLNFSLIGLNVSQYYSVRTEPGVEEYIYAGSQDQGFQRGKDVEGEILNLTQPISGDYGHIQFTSTGKLWTVYPGGWVSFWPQPNDQGIAASYTLQSEDETVWIPPLAAPPHEFSDHIYMAGGNINGGTGSHIIRLEAVGSEINASQLDYDFLAASGGTVSAITVADNYEETIYAATDNGRFFYSNDFGETFTQTVAVPGGHYLYGQAIVSSKTNKQIVFTGGNGLNGISVMKSTNGGESFESYSDGLPETVVLGMVMNSEESLLFAATTDGPYVCILSENKWYSMLGEYAPDVNYWSVELVNNDQTARFGTYGRGIWDFTINTFVGNEETEISLKSNIKMYPNPAIDNITFEWPKDIQSATILNNNGVKLIDVLVNKHTTTINIANLQPGTYILQTMINEQVYSQLFIKS